MKDETWCSPRPSRPRDRVPGHCWEHIAYSLHKESLVSYSRSSYLNITNHCIWVHVAAIGLSALRLALPCMQCHWQPSASPAGERRTGQPLLYWPQLSDMSPSAVCAGRRSTTSAVPGCRVARSSVHFMLWRLWHNMAYYEIHFIIMRPKICIQYGPLLGSRQTSPSY